jgi:hypothetical protein
MLARIAAAWPVNVSRHCGDPALRSVVDVGAAIFSASNAPIFTAAQNPVVWEYKEWRNWFRRKPKSAQAAA